MNETSADQNLNFDSHSAYNELLNDYANKSTVAKKDMGRINDVSSINEPGSIGKNSNWVKWFFYVSLTAFIVVSAALSYVYVSNSKKYTVRSTTSRLAKPTIAVNPSRAVNQKSETQPVSWLTFSNVKYNVQFDYPDNLVNSVGSSDTVEFSFKSKPEGVKLYNNSLAYFTVQKINVADALDWIRKETKTPADKEPNYIPFKIDIQNAYYYFKPDSSNNPDSGWHNYLITKGNKSVIFSSRTSHYLNDMTYQRIINSVRIK